MVYRSMVCHNTLLNIIVNYFLPLYSTFSIAYARHIISSTVDNAMYIVSNTVDNARYIV